MAGSKSDYLEAALLNHVLGGPNYSRPATVYMALFTVAPVDAGSGTEVAGNGYARVAIPNDGTHWSSGSPKHNEETIEFPLATGSWGEIVAGALFDADTDGNMLLWGDLTVHKTIDSGDIAQFLHAQFTVTED